MKNEGRIGNQTPTTSYVLPYQRTKGEQAIRLYEASRRKAMEWQRLLMYDILAVNEEGLWTHSKFGWEIPRRNGKGEILIIRELYALAMGERVLHTAHRTDTAHSAWQRLCDALDAIGIEYRSIRAKGAELIKIADGGSVNFRTRTAKGGLGEGFDVLVIDEAQEYQDDQESALKYVISDSPNPQTLFCGTPPTPVSSGTVFVKYREDVLKGERENSGWAEWSVDEMSDPKDEELWWLTNPSLGTEHLTARNVADEVGSDAVDFNIQRLGLWVRTNLKSAISANEWRECQILALPKFEGKIAVGIKFSKDGETVSLAVGLKTADGNTFVEVVNHQAMRNGVTWIMNFLVGLGKNLSMAVIDGQNGQTLLDREFKDSKFKKFTFPTVAQVVAANSKWEQGIFDKTIVHMEQPSLTTVVTNCEKRTIGSRGGFGYLAQKADADISLMDAAILAAWAADEYKGTTRKQKIYI